MVSDRSAASRADAPEGDSTDLLGTGRRYTDSAPIPLYYDILAGVGAGDVSLSDISRGTGLSLSHISRVFNVNRKPSMDAASAIANYLGITIDTLYAELSRQKRKIRVA